MAIELIDKIKPKNGGDFPMVEAADVALPDGTRLDAAIVSITPVYLTQSAYDALVEAGTYGPNTLYFILEDTAGGGESP